LLSLALSSPSFTSCKELLYTRSRPIAETNLPSEFLFTYVEEVFFIGLFFEEYEVPLRIGKILFNSLFNSFVKAPPGYE